MVGRRTAILVVAIALAAGCGRNAKLLPPSPPGPPPQLKGAAGLALAEELLSVLGAKDDGFARVKSRVQDAMGKAYKQGDAAGENDMSLLFTIIGRAEEGNIAGAERQLRELIDRSKDAIAK
jgi:hypothetical protein